jgi:hypothetical protein
MCAVFAGPVERANGCRAQRQWLGIATLSVV